VIFASGDKTRRVNRRLTMLDSGMSREEVYAALVRMPDRPKPGDWGPVALLQILRRYCRQAGVSISPERLLGIAAAIAGGLWLLAMAFTRSGSGIGLLVNGVFSLAAAALLAFGAVWLWLRRMRNRRLKKIEEQLPTALDIINRALRAGHPVVSAIQLAADEMGDPVGSEFGLIVDETTYGVAFDDALVNFARRTGSDDAHFFAVSVSIQSETGGNLAEILGGLATVIRGRNSLAKRVRALASEGRASAVLLSTLPVVVVLIQLLIHPHVYLDKANDPIFQISLVVTAVVYGLGWLMIYRIINFRY
jgi:tight adherence protein B